MRSRESPKWSTTTTRSLRDVTEDVIDRCSVYTLTMGFRSPQKKMAEWTVLMDGAVTTLKELIEWVRKISSGCPTTSHTERTQRNPSCARLGPGEMPPPERGGPRAAVVGNL